MSALRRGSLTCPAVAHSPAVLRRRAVLVVLALCAAPRTAAADGSLSGVVDLRYQRRIAGDELRVDNAVTVGLRGRVLAGRRAAPCFGLDLRGGHGGGGATWAAEMYPLGIGYRHGPTSQIALCAGVGASGGPDGAVPFAWTVPVELHWEGTGQYGIARPLLFARLARVVSGGQREDGSSLAPLADELSAGVGLRVVVPGQPIEGLFTGEGVFIGLTYDEALGGHTIGVALGHAFATSR